MPKDIKKTLKNYTDENINLSENHTKKFEAKLMQNLHQSKPKNQIFAWLSIAASLVLLVSLAIQFYPTKNIEDIKYPIENNESNQPEKVSLGSISPELNTIETYYTNSINYELSQLDLNENNKEILDQYLAKIGELTKEYKKLTQELSKKGINDATVDALISNLQLRLQLLKRLKKQLNDLKNLNTKQDENQII